MSPQTNSQNSNPTRHLVQYFLLAFSITWLPDIPRRLADKNLAIMGPFLAAFALTLSASGWQGAVESIWPLILPL